MHSVGVEFHGKSAYSEKKTMVFTGSQKARETIPYLPYFLYSFSEHELFSAGLIGVLI